MANIGDVVWIPTATHEPVRSTCPDCLGTARWHCVLPCGEEFDVECPRCYHGGYDPSDGIVCESHDVVQAAAKATITGMELRDGVLQYATDRGCGLTDEDICQDEASALERSQAKARAYWDAEDARMLAMAKRKGRPHKRADGTREANPLEFGGGSANYARGQVRAAIQEANKWIAFAARHGTTIDLRQTIDREAQREEEAENVPTLTGQLETMQQETDDDAKERARERETVNRIEQMIFEEVDRGNGTTLFPGGMSP